MKRYNSVAFTHSNAADQRKTRGIWG